MNTQEILKEALKLGPDERFLVVEGLLKSLDEPDSKIALVWAEEAERRLEAYKAGKLSAIDMDSIFKDN